MTNAFLVKPLALGTVTASSSAAGTLPQYLDNDFIGVIHRGTETTTGATISVDFGSVQAVDFAALLSAPVVPSTYALTAGSTAGASDLLNATGLPFVAGSTAPLNGRQHSWWSNATPVSSRYWKFALGTLPGVAFEAGRLAMGAKFQPVRNFSFGATRGVVDRGGVDFSRFGVPLVTNGVRQRTAALAFQRLNLAEAEQAVADLLEYLGNSRTVMIVVDGAADAQRSRRMYFGYLTGDLTQTWRTANAFEWRANFTSLI